MKRLLVVFGFCTLHLISNLCAVADAARNPYTPEETSGATGAKRKARDASLPAPISCKLMPWSPWSPCNACTDKKFRFRYMEKPSQYGGTECLVGLWDTMTCPRATDQCLVEDYCVDSFTCQQSGRCIGRTLRCNADRDCGDSSDEDDCEAVTARQDKCSTFQPVPGAKRGVQGYNVLTGEFVDMVLDPEYYGGLCEYVYNGEWRRFTYDTFCETLKYNDEEKNYRKPYNYHTYRFMAHATSEGSQDFYEDMVSLLAARKTENSFNAGVTIGVGYVKVGLKGSEESKFLKNVTQHKSQELGFIRIMSKVQTSKFKMRSNELMLHEDMYESLMELPERYDFGLYSRFLHIFGTHYVTEGTMRGSLEYIVVVNKSAMSRMDVNGKQVGRCIGASLGLGSTLGKFVSVDLTLRGEHCWKSQSYNKEEVSKSGYIEDVITLVNGGVVDTSSGLLAIRDPDTYRRWGATLKYNPALIEHETMPIYELVRLSTAAGHVGERLANLRRAVDEYLLQFNPCRCAPCRNNGMPALVGTACRCLCKTGYEGEACQVTRRATKADGSWTCWGAWPSCQSGTRSRTRACTNPPPEGGGAICRGSSSQSQRC